MTQPPESLSQLIRTPGIWLNVRGWPAKQSLRAGDNHMEVIPARTLLFSYPHQYYTPEPITFTTPDPTLRLTRMGERYVFLNRGVASAAGHNAMALFVGWPEEGEEELRHWDEHPLGSFAHYLAIGDAAQEDTLTQLPHRTGRPGSYDFGPHSFQPPAALD